MVRSYKTERDARRIRVVPIGAGRRARSWSFGLRASRIRPFSTYLTSLLFLCAAFFVASTNVQAACSNPVACENQLTGSTGWDPGSGDSTIQGFATDISVNAGGTVSFKVSTNAKAYVINIYRMGYYQGNGARLITTLSPDVSLPQTQPACLTNSSVGLADCGNWALSAHWAVPTTAVSGIYFANLKRSDTGGTSQMFFIVRNDASHSDILYQTSDETWAAYNDYGGHSLYGGAGTFDLNNRAYKVSYNRPYDTRNFEAATFVYNAEYPMVRWMEANGYDVSYFTGVDAARNGSLITNHKIYVTAGHDEYVTPQHRASIEAARSAGVNLAAFTGNEVFWKTRWENSTDGSNTPFRTLVTYKETYFGTGTTYVQDPNDPPTWTGTWRDPRFSPPADGGRPENALNGTIFRVNGPGSDNTNLSIVVPAADGKMRFWRNTSIATLGSGQSVTLPAGTLGYEWDSDMDNGFRPAGLVPLSTSTYAMTDDLLLDYGATYGAGSVTHHLSLFRDRTSGALVFGAGTVQWAWGLDGNHDGSGGGPDSRMQQATVNLFADMGAQPTTLQSGLVAATKSTDTTPPTATITSPSSGSSVPYGSAVTVTGTAADSGGGVVGAVEVSTDGGTSWHPATGREQWSYKWTASSTSGSATLMARAVDDSANLQATPTSVTFAVSGGPTCPCSIWNNSPTPGTPSASDPDSVELGLKFRSDVNGFVTGVRFYKGSGNTGTHIGNLWSSAGAKLATVTFTNETTGWQQANFSSPVAISANTTYVVSYFAPNGGYAADENFFGLSGVDNAPLHALANGVDGSNGVFLYSTASGFPVDTFNSTNYWVDVVFTSSTTSSTGRITGAITGTTTATVALSGTATATVTQDASGNYTFTGLADGPYTVTPSKTGFTFTPASQNATVSNGGTVTLPAFAASTAPTFTLSGTIAGGSGATVSLSGAATATTTADASGNYSFTVVNGTYTVTPSKSGLVFTPTSQTKTVNGANVTGVNFSATQTVSIWSSSAVPANPSESDASAVELGMKFRSDVSGTVTGVRFYKGSSNSGQHIGDLWTSTGTKLASVTFTNETATGWQQANFSTPVSISANTTYVVSYYAPNGGYAEDDNFFASSGVDNPPLHALVNTAGEPNGVYFYGVGGGFPNSTFSAANYWVDLVFVPGATFSISGTITGASSVTVGLSGTATASVTTDASGNYTFGNLANGNYTVTPSKSGFTFTPQNAAVTINGANVTGTNFTAAAAPTFSISGTVTGATSVTVALSGTATATTTTDASGNYSFANLANGSYTVTPSKAGFGFTPASAPVTINGANVSGVNFAATAVPTFSISGTITGGSGATVALSGTATASVTADGSGNYSFPNLANGNYTVTPSKAGFTIAPPNAAVTVSGANVSGINFTATATAGLATDAKVFADKGSSSKTVATAAFSTKSGNELLLALIATDGPSSGTNNTVTGVAGGGLTWTLVKRTNTQRGTSEIWRAFAPAVLTNVTVTATLAQNETSSMTVVSFTGVDTSGTGGSGAIGATGTGNGASGAPTANLVTTRNNSWVFGVGNDWDNATARTPGSGQTLVHQYLSPNGDTYWVQMQNSPTPASGTTVSINDTAPTTDKYNLSICEILPAP